MKRNRRAVFAILLTGLLLLSGFLLRDFLLANFIKPIALVLWVGNRLLATIDQAAYWTILILVITIMALLRFARKPEIREVDAAQNGNNTLNSIQHWRNLILLTRDETDRLNFFKHAMQLLLKDLYAAKEPSQVPWEIYQSIEKGEIQLPASIRAFLVLDPPPKTPPTPAQGLKRITEAPARWVRRWTKQEQADYYQSIADTVSFMEKELENDDE